MILDTTLLNIQHSKVRIKGKVKQSRERSSAPLHLGVVAIEKGAFWSPSTTVANFTFTGYVKGPAGCRCRRRLLAGKSLISTKLDILAMESTDKNVISSDNTTHP